MSESASCERFSWKDASALQHCAVCDDNARSFTAAFASPILFPSLSIAVTSERPIVERRDRFDRFAEDPVCSFRAQLQML